MEFLPEVRHWVERRELLGSPGYWEEVGPVLVEVDVGDLGLLLDRVRGLGLGLEFMPVFGRLQRVVDSV